jgi:hypothetical protein
VRDHVIATAYLFEESYEDTVDAQEFRANMLAEFDRVMKRVAAEYETEFGASHDLAPARKYIEKDLRGLFEDCIQEVHRGGVWTAAGTAVFRMAFGGFPIRKVDQLMSADPRDVVKTLLAHCLNKAQIRKDAANAAEEQAHAELLKALSSGPVAEQLAARRKLEDLGPRVLARLEHALKDAEPKSGAATRIEETLKKVREALEARRTALIARLTKQLEDDWIHPPAEKKEEVEKKLARVLGAHIEAEVAPGTGQTPDHGFHETAPQPLGRREIRPAQTVGQIGRVARQQFVPPITTQRHRHPLAGEPAKHVRGKERRVRDRIVKERRDDRDKVLKLLRVQPLLVVACSGHLRNPAREGSF